MRIANLICSSALLALAGGSAANAATADPNDDYDCATTFQFFYKMAKAKQAPADLLEQVLIMNMWYAEKWGRDHPGPMTRQQFDHYSEIVTAMGDNPKAYRDTLNTCSSRANSDPGFPAFVSAFRKNPPTPR